MSWQDDLRRKKKKFHDNEQATLEAQKREEAQRREKERQEAELLKSNGRIVLARAREFWAKLVETNSAVDSDLRLDFRQKIADCGATGPVTVQSLGSRLLLEFWDKLQVSDKPKWCQVDPLGTEEPFVLFRIVSDSHATPYFFVIHPRAKRVSLRQSNPPYQPPDITRYEWVAQHSGTMNTGLIVRRLCEANYVPPYRHQDVFCRE